MPEQWIDGVVGDEAHPRPGFENELGRTLQREWRGSAPWRAIAWGAAAAVLMVGAIVVFSRDDGKKVVPADTTVGTTIESTVPPSTEPSTTGVDTTTSVDETTTTVNLSDLSGVELYLTALARGEYAVAARLLDEGGLELEARADIRPLFRPEFGLVPGLTNRDAVAAALQKWCAVALCVQPTEIVDLPDGRWTRAVFPTPSGPQPALFTDFVFEGQTGVTGLPPMRPVSAGDGMVVNCPTDAVRVVAWADLDGDGWIEQLVGRSTGSAFNDESGVENFVVTTCGTSLQVEPFAITGDSLAIYPVRPGSSAADTLLIGFLEGVPSGGIYALDGGELTQQDGPAGPATWWLRPSYAGPPESVGCAAVTPGSAVELVTYTYTLVGGSELSNSTALEYEVVNALGGDERRGSGTLTLPAQEQEAGRIVIGYCGDLPIQAF